MSAVSRETSWWDRALEYFDLKWPTLAPRSRLSLAEALVVKACAQREHDSGRG